MNNNIVNFPTRSVREWLIIERALNEELAKLGVPPAVHSRVLERMKAFFQVMDVSFNFTSNIAIPGAVSQDQIAAICSGAQEHLGAQISEQIHDFTNKIFFDRLCRELEVCRELGLL